MDALGLVNNALMRMGERSISSLDEQTATARVASAYLPFVLDEASTEHEWSFAKHRTQLTAGQDGGGGYLYEYELPEDCLLLLSVSGGGQYELEGIEPRMLLTNASDPDILYLRRLYIPGDPVELRSANLPIKFLEAVSCRLASKISIKLSGNGNIAQMMMQEYVFMLRSARNQDASESPGIDEDHTRWEDL